MSKLWDRLRFWWFWLFAHAGVAEYQYRLGCKYFHGDGVSEDYERSAHWHKMAALQDHAGGQYFLGYMYCHGEGTPQDFEQAVHWYKLAAEQGDLEAQYELGFMYDIGDGVPQDFEQALRWYTQAADGGCELANLLLETARMNCLDRRKL